MIQEANRCYAYHSADQYANDGEDYCPGGVLCCDKRVVVRT